MVGLYTLAAFTLTFLLCEGQVNSDGKGFCLTPTCIVTATDLIRSMNTTVDPCEDFYEYACGKWIKDNNPPYYTSEWAVVYQMRYDIQIQINDILTKGHSPGDPEAVRKVKDIYKACMNEKLIEIRRERPLMPVLRTLGGWPMLEENWDEENFNIMDTLVKLNDVGLSPLFRHGVWTGFYEDENTYFFQVDQPELIMARRFFIEPRYTRFLDNLKKFTTEMAQALGSRVSDLDKQVNDMVEFIVKLAKATSSPKEREDWDLVHTQLTISEFYKQNTEVNTVIDLVAYINTLLDTTGQTARATLDTRIINYGNTTFWSGLTDLLRDTPKRTIANYMVFNLVYNTVGYLSEEQFGGIVKRWVEPIWGSSRRDAREWVCSGGIISDFSWSVGRMYIDNFFPPESKKIASSMVEDIRNVFVGMLSKVNWMDKTARDAGVAKAHAIKKNVGYPESLVNERQINELYKFLHSTSGTYFENVLATWQYQWRSQYLNFGKKVDISAWSVEPTVINAFYEPWLNRISLPAAILQVPFYHKDYPKYLNFAGIGYIIGHELTHGFDNSGKEYDLNGNKRQWWSKEVIAKYTKHAQCFVKQYNNYYVPEVNRYVNGEWTLNENIADNGGILESFRAYRTYIARNGGQEESVLPGLGLTPNQLFYLNTAQVWCGKVFTAGAWDWDLNEVHSPMRYRVWGSLQNSPDFHKAFKCAKGTKMNPRHQCNMW